MSGPTVIRMVSVTQVTTFWLINRSNAGAAQHVVVAGGLPGVGELVLDVDRQQPHHGPLP